MVNNEYVLQEPHKDFIILLKRKEERGGNPSTAGKSVFHTFVVNCSYQSFPWNSKHTLT